MVNSEAVLCGRGVVAGLSKPRPKEVLFAAGVLGIEGESISALVLLF